MADGGVGSPMPRKHLVHPLRHHPEPRQGSAAPGHLSSQAAGDVRQAARARASEAGRRPVSRPRLDGARLRRAGRGLRGLRAGRGVSQGSHRPHRGCHRRANLTPGRLRRMGRFEPIQFRDVSWRMDLRQLEIIRAIAETGSFTAAGNKLHVSQSAISRQILLLEEELKEAVFLRVGRRIRITPAGEALLQLSHRVFQDLKDTIAGITDSQESLRGQVRLLGGMTVCLYVFPPLLTELKRQHPNIDLKLVTGSSERCMAHLRSGSGDLALLTLPVDQPDLVTVPVMQEELLLVTAAKHPLSKKRKILPQDLVRQPFVLFESGSNSRRVVDEFFMTSHIEPQIVMETENVEIIKAMVRNGIGMTIIPFQAVARDVAGGNLFCARIEGRSLVRETGWVYPKMSRTPRTVQEVIRAFDRVRPKLKLAP